MSTAQTSAKAAASKSVLFLSPSKVKQTELHGRAERVSDQAILAMADSIRKNGQLQPILVRKDFDGAWEVVVGSTRHAAGLLIEQSDQTFKLQARQVEVNQQEAFVLAIIENNDRNNVSPLDHAFNIKRLTEQFGFTTKAVAELYRTNKMWVTDMLRILRLPNELRAKIGSGEINASAAIQLTRLPEAEAVQVVQAVESTVKVEVEAEVEAEVEQVKAKRRRKTAKPETPSENPSPEAAATSEPDQALPETPEDVELAKEIEAVRKKGARKVAAAVSKAVTSKIRDNGARIGRTAGDLLKLIGNRDDAVSVAITAYLKGDGDEAPVFEALDACEAPVCKPVEVSRPADRRKAALVAKAAAANATA